VPADQKDRFGRGRYVLGLFLVGLVSGFLTCCTAPLYTAPPYTADSGGISTFGLFGSPLASVIFGLVVSVYVQAYKNLRSVGRVLGFIGASIVADIAAFVAGWDSYAAFLNRQFKVIGVDAPQAASLVAGGFVGAAILFIAFRFLLSVNRGWPRFFLGLLICSVTGSSLAILGWGLAPSLGAVLWRTLNLIHLDASTAKIAQESNYAAFYSLYVVWQSGMAVLLGVLLPRQTEEFGSSEKGHSMNLLRLSP
jgi:hypothetical protein